MRKIMLAAVVAMSMLCSCTDEDGTRRALEKQGFTDIRTEGYAFYACSDNDNYATKFTAKNPNGQTVSGVVCCGVLKSCTVRW